MRDPRGMRWWRVIGFSRSLSSYEIGSFLAKTAAGAIRRARRDKAGLLAGLRLEAH